MVQDSPNIGSLFDFIYVDQQKVNYLYSQLVPNGVLKQRSLSLTSQNSTNSQLGVNLGLQAKHDAVSSNTEGENSVFDTNWSAPLVLLDHLDQYGYIRRGLKDASVGSIVLITGSLHMLDTGVLREGWKPLLEITKINAESSKEREELKKLTPMMNQIGELIKATPPAAHISLHTQEDDLKRSAWASTKPHFYITNPHELTLESGDQISGTWSILGILNDYPAPFHDDDISDDGGVNDLGSKMMNLLRRMLGRKAEYYSVSPILIFRSINLT